VAELLDCSTANVRALVKRHRLAASGDGKARRLPRETVQSLIDRATQGTGPETINHYVRAVRGFFNWLVKAKRLPSNPLDSLAFLNAEVDVRRARRELEADELRRLLAVTLASSTTFRGLTGPDRFHLYLTAAASGFRASALSNLEPGDFDLESEMATITLAARFNKSRKQRVQPLPGDVAEALAVYLAGRPAGVAVWGGSWARDHRGAEMLRIDLDAAGIPYAVEGPDGPLYADFHSLRHSYLTLLGRGGVDLRTAQELAGHSTPILTARYSHRRLYDLAGAVEKLPSFLPSGKDGQEAEAIRATGTEGLATSEVASGCSVVARTPSIQGHHQALRSSEGGDKRHSPETTQPQENPGVGHRETLAGITSHQRGRRDSNPQPPDRQSHYVWR
jgi:integrase